MAGLRPAQATYQMLLTWLSPLDGYTQIWLPRALIERLAHGDIALLLRGPVAAAGDGAIDHQIVPVDETGFVAGEKHRGIGDVVGQPGALDRLCGLVDLAHHIGRLLRRLDRKTQRLAQDAGGDRAR